MGKGEKRIRKVYRCLISDVPKVVIYGTHEERHLTEIQNDCARYNQLILSHTTFYCLLLAPEDGKPKKSISQMPLLLGL